MNKLILFTSLLGLTNCASMIASFEDGQREGAQFWSSFAQQAARHPDWNGQSDASRTEEIRMIQQHQTVCIQAVDYFGRVIPCN